MYKKPIIIMHKDKGICLLYRTQQQQQQQQQQTTITIITIITTDYSLVNSIIIQNHLLCLNTVEGVFIFP